MIKSKKNKNLKKIDLNIRIYPLEVILGSVYAFLDKAFMSLDHISSELIRVNIEPRENISGDRVLGDLKNELINQLLRNHVSRQNQSIREYIVASAILGAAPKKVKTGKVNEVSNVKTGADNPDLGLSLENDKDLLKELKKIEKEFSITGGDFDFKNDTMGIAVPWEEKFKRKK